MTWDRLRLKHAVENVLDAPVEPLPLVALEHIAPKTGALATDYAPIVVERFDHVRFRPGDVLYGKLRPYLRKSWLATFAGSCPKELLVLRAVNGRLDARYLSYLVQSDLFANLAAESSEGAKMPRTSWESLARSSFLIPPLPTQLSVADHVDRETAQIDRVVVMKERLMAGLSTRRAQTITEAVTGASLPGARARHHRRPWLGLLPAAWPVSGS